MLRSYFNINICCPQVLDNKQPTNGGICCPYGLSEIPANQMPVGGQYVQQMENKCPDQLLRKRYFPRLRAAGNSIVFRQSLVAWNNYLKNYGKTKKRNQNKRSRFNMAR